MRKTLACVCTAILTGAIALSACASSYELKYTLITGTNGKAYYSATGIKESSGKDLDVKIASEYQGVPVLSVGSRAFYRQEELKHVKIPNGLERVEDEAFSFCMNLTDADLPSSVYFLGERAFSSCEKLKAVTFGNPDLAVGAGAFSSCYDLKRVSLPLNLKKLEASTFEACYDLAQVEFPAGLTEVGDYAFQGCESLTSITLPDSVKKLGAFSFAQCKGLESIVFEGRDNEMGTTTIADNAFSDCKQLKFIALPKTLSKIETLTFSNCSSLNSIVVGKRVTVIEEYAFSHCINLCKVYYEGSEMEWARVQKDGAFNTGSAFFSVLLYSENEPTLIGNYWHYVNGEIVEW